MVVEGAAVAGLSVAMRRLVGSLGRIVFGSGLGGGCTVCGSFGGCAVNVRGLVTEEDDLDEEVGGSTDA